ncbi:calpain 7 protein [Echinococcus multilocularis]|uniref:Calpain 7 protein n=1 Tax=Echinococcus multilocularis TaxID=6211 RepID=A0A068Y2M0_ECHMU|nr:calpain 7 protein [Echinococcus multilocularis]
MGAWRRINIDDRITVDENSQRILPWLKSNELWLPLLCKALLKVAAIDHHLVKETWILLKPLLPEWQRLNKENKFDGAESERSVNSAPFVFVEGKKEKDVLFSENTRSVMEAGFMANLEAKPQKLLLHFRRQQPLISPEDLPPVPAWKKIRGPPKSLKHDEEHEPIRSVLLRLLRNENSGNEAAGLSTEKKPDITQGNEGHETSKMNGWFDIEDVCKFFNELQIFYNPKDLAFIETLTVVKNATEESVASKESYLFVDSLDDIEVIIDFHTTVCRNSDESRTMVRIEPTDWLSSCRQPPITTLSMENRQSVSLRIPRGRHCYRIILETPLAVSLTLFTPCTNPERTIFVLGPMETCMQEAVKEPLQNVHNGCQFLDKFCEIARSFIEAAEKINSTASRYGSARDSFLNFLGKIFTPKPIRILEKVIYENIAELISKHNRNKDSIGISDARLGWKVLIIDPSGELKLKEAKVEDKSPSTEMFGRQDGNELKCSAVRGIIGCQALFRGHFTRRILRSAKFPLSEDRVISPDIQRSVKGLKYLLDCLNETTESEKTGLLRSIQSQLGCRHFSDDANFFTQRLQSGTMSNVSFKSVGCIWSAPANYVQSGVRKQHLNLLFHQKIYISEELARIRINLESDEGFARVIIIDNDSGGEIKSKRGGYLTLEANKLGYCLLAYVLSGNEINSNLNWQFTYLYEGWRDLNFSKISANFAFWEANGVLEVNEEGLVFRFSLDVSLRQIVSVVLKIGNSTARARLILRSSEGSELAASQEEPKGVHLMPALLLGPDMNSEVGGTTKSDNSDVGLPEYQDADASKALGESHNHKKCQEKPPPIEGVDSNTRKTDSLCHYILEAYVKVDELHLSEEERTMIAKIKEARMNEMRVDYEEKPRVSSDMDSCKAKTRIGSVRRVHTPEHPTLPSWNCKVYFNAANPGSVVFKPYGLTPAELREVQRSWLGENACLRLEEARRLRQAYIVNKSPRDPNKTADPVEGGTGNTNFGIPEVEEEEYTEFMSLLSCNYSGERQSGLTVAPNANGTNLKHCSEGNIRQKIWEIMHLAEEIQISEMKMRKLLTQ